MIKNLFFTAKLALFLVFSFLSLNVAAQTTTKYDLLATSSLSTVPCGVTSFLIEIWASGGMVCHNFGKFNFSFHTLSFPH